MIQKPIYKPKGNAGEYADWALNIYTGCTHACKYCYAPRILRKSDKEFAKVDVRKDIVESVCNQLKRTDMKGNLIHLCFTCDPYPRGIDTTITRKIIEVIKESGNHVQILTKSTGVIRDLDLLDKNDWVGITLTGAGEKIEPYAASESERINVLLNARARGINTWVSYEPVIDQLLVLGYIRSLRNIVNKIKIGKPNYYKTNTYMDWDKFVNLVKAICADFSISYYLKDSLREGIK